jgi:hypothetical protein
MPAVRSLFSLAFPKVFSTTRKGSNYSFGSAGPSLMLSSQPKAPGGTNHRQLIKVQEEWTVVTSDVGRERFNSDEELVRPPTERNHSSSTPRQ